MLKDAFVAIGFGAGIAILVMSVIILAIGVEKQLDQRQIQTNCKKVTNGIN